MPQATLFSFIISYLIGSFPTAFIVVKKRTNIDIRNKGSGNVGGRNALEVTGKKSIGIIVTAIDVFKGIFAIEVIRYFFIDPASMILAMGGVVLGHCFSVWLKFKGGRGLATTAGVFLSLFWIVVPSWLATYFIIQKLVKDVHLASAIALIGIPIYCWFLPFGIFRNFLTYNFSQMEFFVGGILVAAICIVKHTGPLLDLLKIDKTT